MFNTNNKNESSDQITKSSRWIIPAADIISNENGFNINLDMPGVIKDKLSLKVDSDELLVSGELENGDFKTSDYYYNELNYAGYQRTFILPKDIDPDKIEAAYENGVLKLALNKKEEYKPKLIEIK